MSGASSIRGILRAASVSARFLAFDQLAVGLDLCPGVDNGFANCRDGILLGLNALQVGFALAGLGIIGIEGGLSGENDGFFVAEAFGLGREGGIEGSPRGIDVGAVVTGWSGIGGPGGLQGDDALAGLAEICEEICFVLDLLALILVGGHALIVVVGIGAQCGPGGFKVVLPIGIIEVELRTQCLLQTFLLLEQKFGLLLRIVYVLFVLRSFRFSLIISLVGDFLCLVQQLLFLGERICCCSSSACFWDSCNWLRRWVLLSRAPTICGSRGCWMSRPNLVAS